MLGGRPIGAKRCPGLGPPGPIGSAAYDYYLEIFARDKNHHHQSIMTCLRFSWHVAVQHYYLKMNSEAPLITSRTLIKLSYPISENNAQTLDIRLCAKHKASTCNLIREWDLTYHIWLLHRTFDPSILRIPVSTNQLTYVIS